MWTKIKKNTKYLDPYTYMDLFINFLHQKGIKNKLLDICIYILFSIVLAYIILSLLGLLLGTDDAMMIVFTGSMTGTINIGDIVVLEGAEQLAIPEIIIDNNLTNKHLEEFAKMEYELKTSKINNLDFLVRETKGITIDNNFYPTNKNSDIIVYYSAISGRKIIHRAQYKFIANDGNFIVTKGDYDQSNFMLDQEYRLGNSGEKLRICEYPIPEDKLLARYLFRIPYIGYIKIIPAKIISFFTS